jgi:DNA polymerase-3 subunit gamma/tau
MHGLAFGGQGVGADDVRDVLGFMPGDLLDAAVDGLRAGDSKSLLDLVAAIVDRGLNLQQFVRECISRVRDLLLVKLKLDEGVLGSDAETQELKRRAEGFSEQDLIRIFDMGMRLEGDLRYVAQPRFQLEVGLIKMARLGHLRDVEEVLRDLRGAAPAPSPEPRAPAASATAAPPVRRTVPAPPPAPPSTPRAPERPEAAPRPTPPPERPAPSRPSAPPAETGADSEPLVKRFLEVFRGDIAQVKPLKEEDR